MKLIIFIAIVSALPAIALDAAFSTSEGLTSGPYIGTYGTYQNTEILFYDSGVMGYSICWFNGFDHWVGNDFDVRIYSDINSMIIRTRDDWPNDGFDGFYIAIFDDKAGLPGKIIWPIDGSRRYVSPYELQTNYDSEGWVEIDVNYSVTDDTIYACMEQYYSHPDADPFCVDDDPNDQGHSWEDDGNGWRPMNTGDLGDITNNNLMLRLRVTLSKGVRKTSLGEIKALYR